MQKYNVVIQTAFIGDLFLSIPLLERLSILYPKHKTILVCKKGLGEFFLKLNLVDQVFEIEKGHRDTYNHAIDRINVLEVDNVFCLHRSLRSALFTWKIRAHKKIGFGSVFKGIFFDHTLGYPTKWPDVIRQLFILTPVDSELSAAIQERDWSYLNFMRPDHKFEPIPKIFQFPTLKLDRKEVGQKQVAIFPGSVWATKKWTLEGYAHVAQRLMSKGYRVCVLGGEGDHQDALQIQRQAPGVEVLTGQMSLYESAVYIHHFDLVICNDSAPAHIAACLQRPVLTLFGPTVLDFGFRPWNDLSQVIEIDQLSCRPCGPHGHAQCPLGHHHCMRKIDLNTVSQKAFEMLGEI